MRLSENHGIVNVLSQGDYQAGSDGDSFSLKQYRHATIIISFATLTGDAVLTVNSGASAGTKTTAETFNYRYADADELASGADQFSAWATSAGLTLTAATYSDRLLIVEIDASEITSGQPWITINFSAAADALNAAVVAILSEPRYSDHDMPTAIS